MKVILLFCAIAQITCEISDEHQYKPFLEKIRRIDVQFNQKSYLYGLIQQYLVSHNDETIQKLIESKAICNGKFVVGTYGCPMQVGNRMHEFLNAFAGAIVTNRTLLWHYCDRSYCKTSKKECEKCLTRQSWIPPAHQVLSELVKNKCLNHQDVNDVLGSKRNVVPFKQHIEGAKVLFSKNLDHITDKVINFGVLERHEMFILSHINVSLNEPSRSRARTLFSIGEYEAYGTLFYLTFTFSKQIIQMNQNHIYYSNSAYFHNQTFQSEGSSPSVGIHHSFQSEGSSPTIGIHIRHSNYDNNGSVDLGEESCLTAVLRNRTIDMRSHYILVASDRIVTIDRLSRLALDHGKEVITTNKTLATSIAIHHPDRGGVTSLFDTAQKLWSSFYYKSSDNEGGGRERSYQDEHGVWADGLMAIADIELLSHSNIFIASPHSTYSMLVSSLVMIRGYLRYPTPSMYFILSLPNCTHLTG